MNHSNHITLIVLKFNKDLIIFFIFPISLCVNEETG